MSFKKGLTSILLLSVISTAPVHANYSFYNFSKKDSKLTRETFFRWVRPQARNIVSDFYSVLKKLEPIHGNIISLNKQIQKLSYAWEDINQKCYKMTEECKKDFKDFYAISRKVDTLILKIREDGVKFTAVKDSEKLDSLVGLTGNLNKIALLNYELLHYLEESIITSGTSFEAYTNSKGKFNSLIHYMNTSSDIILSAQVDKRYKDEFDFIWVNFISKLEHHVVQKKDMKFLLNRLEDLNIAWNSFHMKMAKGNMGFPRNQVKSITTMHSRWNSILKLILRN